MLAQLEQEYRGLRGAEARAYAEANALHLQAEISDRRLRDAARDRAEALRRLGLVQGSRRELRRRLDRLAREIRRLGGVVS